MSLMSMESFVLPALSGACIALIGVAYRLGQKRGLAPVEILGACCVLGTVTFSMSLFKSGAHLSQMPLSLYAWGLAAGLGQYVAVRLFGTALRFGPLAPVWCVVSLSFVPTMVYSAMFLSESLRPVQYAAVVAAVLCVVVASMQPRPVAETLAASSSRPTLAAQLLYLAILAVIFIVGSLVSVALRAVGAQKAVLGEMLTGQQSHFVLLQCYVVLLVCAGVESGWTGRLRVSPRALAALGLLAGLGSAGGLWLLSHCATSGMAFAIGGISQILVVAVISVLAFGEKTTASWYATVVLGVLAVMLANCG